MGSTKTENESNTLRGSVINSAQSAGKENNWKCDSQELTNLHMCNICLHVLKVSLILFSAHRGSYLRSLPLLGFGFGRHWTDKICLALSKLSTKFGSNFQFFKRGSTESLRQSKTFVNHKCQSHRNKRQILRLKIEIK